MFTLFSLFNKGMQKKLLKSALFCALCASSMITHEADATAVATEEVAQVEAQEVSCEEKAPVATELNA